MLHFTFLLMLTMLLSSCQSSSVEFDFPYKLKQPDHTFLMPDILDEISGIALLNDTIMLCVQDEKGILFFYDLKNKELQKEMNFGKDGDYEDVAIANGIVYVLQSNGSIHELLNFQNQDNIRTKVLKTGLTRKNDCEGLCFDPIENRLLIAAKEKPEINPAQDFTGYRTIYAVDIETKEITPKPAYLIQLDKLIFEHTNKKINIPAAKFHPSAIEIHPISGHIYVLASKGQALLVMSRQGEIIAFQRLPKKQFAQPEGLAFAPDGTMFISNEGAGGKGNILKFEMK